MNTQKNKDQRFDPDYALASFIGNLSNGVLKTSFLISGYIDGFSPVTGYSEKYGFIKHYAINSPLLSLYTTAFRDLATLPANRIVCKIKDKHLFIPNDISSNKCEKAQLYSFEFVASAIVSDQIPGMIKNALDNYFRLTTGFEDIDMTCLVLSATKQFRRIPKATKALLNTLDEENDIKQLYGSSQLLCAYFDVHLDMPVINGLPGELLDITFLQKPPSIENIKEWLMLYGLELIPSVKNMRVFAINETG